MKQTKTIIAMDDQGAKKIKGIPLDWEWEDIHEYLYTKLGFSFDVMFWDINEIKEVDYEG